MSDQKGPKCIYFAYVHARDRKILRRIAGFATTTFKEGLVPAIGYVSDNFMVVSVTSEKPIDAMLVATFEDKVEKETFANILFCFQSDQPTYLFSLFVGYHFDEKKHALQADNFRRSLTYAAYDLTSASVIDFHQSTVATTMVLTSTVPIPDEDLSSILELTQVKQVTTTISFKSF